jgi:hypothetical protein
MLADLNFLPRLFFWLCVAHPIAMLITLVGVSYVARHRVLKP